MTQGDTAFSRYVQLYDNLFLIRLLVSAVAVFDQFALVIVSLEVERGEIPENPAGVDLAKPGEAMENNRFFNIVDIRMDGVKCPANPVVVKFFRPDLEQLKDTGVFGPVLQM